jgi:hypothetical protein
MSALIAPRHLMRPSRLRKKSYVNMLDVGTRDSQRDFIFGFAGGRAGVTADAARVVNDFCPLSLTTSSLINGEFSHVLPGILA